MEPIIVLFIYLYHQHHYEPLNTSLPKYGTLVLIIMALQSLRWPDGFK